MRPRYLTSVPCLLSMLLALEPEYSGSSISKGIYGSRSSKDIVVGKSDYRSTEWRKVFGNMSGVYMGYNCFERYRAWAILRDRLDRYQIEGYERGIWWLNAIDPGGMRNIHHAMTICCLWNIRLEQIRELYGTQKHV